MVLQTYFRLTLTLNWISLRLWHKSPCPWWSCRHFLVTTYSKLDAPKTLIPIWCLLANAWLDKVLRMLLIICSILIGYPQDVDTNLIYFCHFLDTELQTLFGRMLNLNWIPPRLWHISDIFSPCPWSRVADAFWLYAQPKLDTPKDLTHFRYIFAMPLIWSCRRFLVVRST